MEVICKVKEIGVREMYLTYGAKYDVIKVGYRTSDPKTDVYLLRNDLRYSRWYSCNVVVTYDEWREERLGEIGI